MSDLEWLSDYIGSVLKAPTWVVPVAQFCDANCGVFEDQEENKLEYTILHNNFRQLIDDLFLAHLLDAQVTPEQLESFCQNGLASSEALHHLLVEQLLAVDNFLSFKAMMVKWNAYLDRKAALELAGVQEFECIPAEGDALANATQVPLNLYHSDGNVAFAQWTISEEVLAWHDRDFTYSGLPEELLGGVLFAGPHDSVPSGTLTLTSPVNTTLYIIYENSGERRHGGFPNRLKQSTEWVMIGGTQMKWGRSQGKEYWLCVFTRKVSAGQTVTVEVEEPWVGGVAIKADSGDWKLYEEQEQFEAALVASRQECGLDDNPSGDDTATQMAREAALKYEQAELQQAIALSIQAEEERIRQVAESEAAASAAASAAQLREPSLAPAEPQIAVPAPPLPPVEPAPTETPLAAHVEPAAPEEHRPAIPRMMKLQPLQKLQPLPSDGGRMSMPSMCGAAADPQDGEAAVARLQAEAILRREQLEMSQRAQRAIAAPSQSAAPTQVAPTAVAAPAGPTDEERRHRADHLRRQRDLILQKRNAEREQQLRDYQQSNGGRAAVATDQAIGSLAAPGAALAGGLTAPGGIADPTQNGAAESAQRMRQALTLQLRQTLPSVSDPNALGQQVGQLEEMKAK